jgi:hypothetical protein
MDDESRLSDEKFQDSGAELDWWIILDIGLLQQNCIRSFFCIVSFTC